MKHPYFTPETITPRAEEMLRGVLRFRKQRALQFAPRRSALLVLDMQNYFLEASSHAFVPSAPAIIPGIQALVHAFTELGLLVIFTRHLNEREDAGVMARWWRDLITASHPLSGIVDAFDVSGDQLLEKQQYDAFYRTGLEETLRCRSVEQVVICGVMTHLCCETTARSAFVRGFDVFFCIDGTATYNETFHMASLLNLAHGFAVPVLVGEILGTVRTSRGS